MEPIEFALAAIVIPVLSKYVEKPGERLGENTTKQLAKLWNNIKAMPDNNSEVEKSVIYLIRFS